LRRYADLAGVDAGHLSAALHGKRRLPEAWIPKRGEAANEMLIHPGFTHI